jgi:hypothetical protein
MTHRRDVGGMLDNRMPEAPGFIGRARYLQALLRMGLPAPVVLWRSVAH